MSKRFMNKALDRFGRYILDWSNPLGDLGKISQFNSLSDNPRGSLEDTVLVDDVQIFIRATKLARYVPFPSMGREKNQGKLTQIDTPVPRRTLRPDISIVIEVQARIRTRVHEAALELCSASILSEGRGRLPTNSTSTLHPRRIQATHSDRCWFEP